MKKQIIGMILIICILLTLAPSAAAHTGTRAETDFATASHRKEAPSASERKSAPTMRRSDTDIAYPVEGGNIYFDAETGTITDCDHSVTAAVIPSEIGGVAVTGIGEFAFCFIEFANDDNGNGFNSIDENKNLLTVTIPDSVTRIGDSAFEYCTKLRSVTLGNGVTTIGEYAFYHCESLPQIMLPDSVTSIGRTAFSDCESLTQITIPDGVTTIGRYMFYDCTSLTSVTLPDSVRVIDDRAFGCCTSLAEIPLSESIAKIGDSAFYRCTSLTSVTIPDSVTVIGENAFGYCTSLTSVMLPDSVRVIGDRAFANCCALTGVTIPDSVVTIGECVFAACSSLTSVTIPAGVTKIGDRAFYDCANLTGICVDENNQHYSSDAYGVLFNKGKTTLLRAPETISGGYTVPEGVEYIENYAFCDCEKLTKVTLPNNPIRIGDSVFASCLSLTSVAISDGVTSIGSYAFESCTNLTDVTIGNTVTSIGKQAFDDTPLYDDAENWTDGVLLIDHWLMEAESSVSGDYSIPESTVGIADSAFMGCWALTGVTIPNGVKAIGKGAFFYCDSLTSVTIPDSVTIIGDEAFGECSGLTSIIIGNSVTSIGNGAFRDCYSLTRVSLPDSLRSIGERAFCDCKSLASVTMLDGVMSIGRYAFYRCTSLASVILPNSVRYIGESAFYETEFYNNKENWTNNILYLGNWLIKAKRDCSDVLAIPEGTVGIADSAFSFCMELTSVTLPDSLTSIGNDAFENCVSLTSVTIPKGVTTIGDHAFYSCSNLDGIWVDERNINYSSDECGVLFTKDKMTLMQAPGALGGEYAVPYSVTHIDESAFHNCKHLTGVTLPDGLTSIGDHMFSYCDGLNSVSIPESLTMIGERVFYSCKSLTSVTIPESVAIIGERAFHGCDSLKSVCFLGSAPGIADSVFQTWGSDSEYNIPGLTLYYIEGKEGWTTPTWGEDEYPTATWDAVSIPTESAEIFTDVPNDAWYASSVNYVVENGLMNGMGKNEFRPEIAMTRAMLVTVLWRYAGSPTEGTNSFNDLTQDWYVQAVAWASKNGIVNGYPDGIFRPDDEVTREQLATIVYRYCNTVGIETDAGADLSSFPDASKVNSYAADAISWAVSVGLITGITHGGNPTPYLEPQTSATRAHVATILMRFIENVVN